jgi:hypothetical protein
MGRAGVSVRCRTLDAEFLHARVKRAGVWGDAELLLQQLGTPMPDAIDHRLRAVAVVVSLGAWAIEVAVVMEELQPPRQMLPVAAHERDPMRRTQEPMTEYELDQAMITRG